MVAVSVIMPVYEAEEFLENTIENFTKQTLHDVELICVNDGSTDKSGEILDKLSKKYDFIHVINQKNQGSGYARNNGMENATGEYIAFLDADDIFIDDNALEKMYNYGCEHDADIVCADLMRVNLDGEIEENFNYKDNNYLKCNDYGSVKSEEYGMPWAFYKNIFKRTYLEEHNIVFPDLARGQDPVFMAEALVNTDKIYTVPVTLYGYNYAANGGANAKVNNYHKKYDYMMHFKMTIDVLSRAKFVRSAVKYKDQMVTFLSLNRNRDDHELIEIVHDIFEDENTPYFESHDEELIYLRFMILNHENPKELYEEYWPIKRHIRKVVRKYDGNILMHPLIVNNYMKLDSQVN